MLILILNEAVFSFEKGSESLLRFHSPIKKILLYSKIYDLLAPSGGIPASHLLPLFGKP